MKKNILYVLYCLCCCAGGYAAALVKQDLLQVQKCAYTLAPGALAAFLLYALVGALWYGESLWARRVAARVMRWTHIAAILWHVFLAICWYTGSPQFRASVDGAMPALALVTGYLAVSLLPIRKHPTE